MNELEWMMWRVEDGQIEDPPALNLIRAIQYYTEKYGSVPNRCEVHPDMVADLSVPHGMRVSQSRAVKRGHLMLARDPAIDSKLPGRSSAQ